MQIFTFFRWNETFPLRCSATMQCFLTLFRSREKNLKANTATLFVFFLVELKSGDESEMNFNEGIYFDLVGSCDSNRPISFSLRIFRAIKRHKSCKEKSGMARQLVGVATGRDKADKKRIATDERTANHKFYLHNVFLIWRLAARFAIAQTQTNTNSSIPSLASADSTVVEKQVLKNHLIPIVRSIANDKVINRDESNRK